jgi:GTP cyclohydrolase I
MVPRAGRKVRGRLVDFHARNAQRQERLTKRVAAPRNASFRRTV